MSLTVILERSLQNTARQHLADPAHREQVVAVIMKMFTNLPKRPVPDLESRVRHMQQRVETAVQGLSVGFEAGELVVKAEGSSVLLLNEFRRGSSWFAPEPQANQIILTALLAGPVSS